MLVPPLCYWWLISAEISTTFPQCLLRKNIILWNIYQIVWKLQITNNIIVNHRLMHNHYLLLIQMVKFISLYHPLKVCEYCVLTFVLFLVVVSPEQLTNSVEASSSHVSNPTSSQPLPTHRSNSHCFSYYRKLSLLFLF
jgi:hypothetical protein